MQQKHSAKWFLTRLLACVLVVLTLMGAFLYALDPYLAYHASPYPYIISDRFSMTGLIRHSEYDAILIGSSMSQNFDMDLMREKLGLNPLKAVKGGLTISEMQLLNDLAVKTGKAQRVFLNIDLTRFNEIDEAEEYYPAYLYNDTVLDDYQYLFGYEAWMRYMPLDLIVIGAKSAHITLPSLLQKKSNPDLIGYWADRETFSEQVVLNKYAKNIDAVAAQNTEGMYARMVENLDRLLAAKPFAEGVQYDLFLPPYSALYWAHTMREGYFEALCDFRAHLAKRLSAYENVRLFDFQGMEMIEDLNRYKDNTHFDPATNDRMVECFASGEYAASEASVTESNAFLRAAANRIFERFPEIPRPPKP